MADECAPPSPTPTPGKSGPSEMSKLGEALGGILAMLAFALAPVFFQHVLGNANGEPSWTQAEKENAAHFVRAETELKEADRLVLAGIGNADLQRGGRLVAHFKLALAEARLVTSQVLAKMHPELPVVYKEKYIRCLELAIMGLESGDSRIAFAAGDTSKAWNDWWAANKNNVRFPNDVPR
jgi:hypothetical protein